MSVHMQFQFRSFFLKLQEIEHIKIQVKENLIKFK